MDNVIKIQKQTKIEYLAQFIGRTSFQKQSLTNIDHQINSLDHSEENCIKKLFFLNSLKKN
jgi:hypothetical protein